MIVSHIAALGKNKVIGVEGGLPWDLPEDMKFFKEKTSGHIILMGRKTFESFPKPLKNRLHVVITRQKNYSVPEGVKVFPDISKAFEFCRSQVGQWGNEVFVIGGGEIYKQTLDQADLLYLTLIDKEFTGDARYPEYEKDFLIAEKEDHFGDPNFSFCLFTKRK
jgi:dihydrofolate reductase